MYKKIAAGWLAVCACLMLGCGQKEEIPVASWSSSSREETEDGYENLWDESGYENRELPEELSWFEIEIEGETYRLPADFSLLSDRGWNYSGDPEREIDSGSYLEGELFEKDGRTLTACIWNPEGTSSRVGSCRIAGLRLDAWVPENEELQAELPGGLALGRSAPEDAERLYGEPSDRYEGEDGWILTYAHGAYQSVQMGFDGESGKLRMLELLNIEETGQALPAGKPAADPMDTYQEPALPGNTLAESVVEFGGDLYRLPAPVAAFEKNGWSVRRGGSEESVESGQYGTVILERDGTEFYTVVRNRGETAAAVASCLVTEVSGEQDTVPMVLAGGITLGMEKEEFLDRVEGIPRKERPEEGDRTAYLFYKNEAELDYTEITVDEASGRVCRMKVVCNGDSDLEDQVLGES